MIFDNKYIYIYKGKNLKIYWIKCDWKVLLSFLQSPVVPQKVVATYQFYILARKYVIDLFCNGI